MPRYAHAQRCIFVVSDHFSVDAEHFIRFHVWTENVFGFHCKSSVFKFIRYSLDGALD